MLQFQAAHRKIKNFAFVTILFAMQFASSPAQAITGMELAEADCDRGLTAGCHALAGTMIKVNEEIDVRAMNTMLKRYCEGPAFRLCLLTAISAYSSGQSNENRATLASHMFETACKNGSSQACALLLDVPVEVSRRPEALATAEKSFIAKCQKDYAESCFLLAAHFFQPSQSKERQDVAIEILDYSCMALSFPQACTNLGFLNTTGDYFPKDHVKAAKLYHRACNLGDGLGCSNLAENLERGSGVPKNPKQAAELYSIACAQGVQFACGSLYIRYPDLETLRLGQRVGGGS